MAYTNVWDDSAPLDTQAASQGAADFRQTKLDIMQRVASFGAGLLANRPTPEATSGTADWTGVMYWALDTVQTFRWNGSSWDDITTSLPGTNIIISAGQFNTAANTSEQIAYSGTVPGGALGTNGLINIDLSVQSASGSGLVTIALYYGTSNFLTFDTAISPFNQTRFLINLRENGTTALQQCTFTTFFPSTMANSAGFGYSTDSTIDQTLKITVTKTNASDTFEFLGCSAVIIQGS